MSLADRDLHVCSCNATMPLDAAALARALGRDAPLPVHTAMCQRDRTRFTESIAGDAVIACTQEQQVLGDAATEGGRTRTIRFVNIRETAGWSAEAKLAQNRVTVRLQEATSQTAVQTAQEQMQERKLSRDP